MTASELRDKMNNEYGLSPWPKTLEVDAETYRNVEKLVWEESEDYLGDEPDIRWVAHGPNGGIMFKNVELILV